MSSEPRRLLAAHFLRRLIDDDLISPNADRHESLSMIGAMLVSLGLFVSVIASMRYLFNPWLTPAIASVSALGDHFLYTAAAMTATALLTLLVWDGLAVDARDASVLGAMPIRTRTIVAAKFTALITFAAMFAAALNLVPSLVAPGLMVSKLRISFFQLVALILGQVFVVTLAAAFGFFAVLAIRGVLQAALGRTLFTRVAAMVQAVLLVSVASAFLLLPVVASRVRLEPQSRAVMMAPPLWFVGLQEMLTGNILAGLPPGRRLPPRIAAGDARAAAMYAAARPLFPGLAATALIKLAAVTVVALGLFAWNNRRIVPPPPAAAGARWLRHAFTATARLVVRHPETQASFFFTLQALLRSPQHRLSIAASLAFGLTASVFAVAVGTATRRDEAAAFTAGILAIQPVIIAALLMGFRHAVRVPAELAANWAVQVAWAGDTRPHVFGAKAAGALLFVIVPVTALVPLYAALFTASDAVAIAACGLAGGLAALEAMFMSFGKMPFACGYLPANLKTLAPIAFVSFVFFTYQFAHRVRTALLNGSALELAASLAVLFLVLRAVDAYRRRHPRPFEFDELPEPPTQRLGLS